MVLLKASSESSVCVYALREGKEIFFEGPKPEQNIL
jgi:hypothetical protein